MKNNYYLANAKQMFFAVNKRVMLIFILPLPESVFNQVNCTVKAESCLAQEGFFN
jgi:hypothetical protein